MGDRRVHPGQGDPAPPYTPDDAKQGMCYEEAEMTDTGVSADRIHDKPGRRSSMTTSRADLVSSFAAVILLTTASFEVLQGIGAIANDELFLAHSDYLYEFDMTAWGWTHVVLGLLLGAIAVGVLAHKSWAQVTGMIVAGLSMLTNFAFLPYYPLWSLVIIAFNVVAIWALCTQLGRPE
jgi:hypothetical protein